MTLGEMWNGMSRLSNKISLNNGLTAQITQTQPVFTQY